MSDEVLQACRAGDAAAFARLFETFKDHVYSLALRLTGDEAMAGDVAQDVFVKLMTRIHQFRRQAELSTWIYRIVVNTSMDHRRAGRRLVAVEEMGQAPRSAEAASQEEEVLRRQLSAQVAGALQTLLPKMRIPLVLRHVAGLSYDEIGRVLGISPGTVASRLSRGHRKLARRLKHLEDLLASGGWR